MVDVEESEAKRLLRSQLGASRQSFWRPDHPHTAGDVTIGGNFVPAYRAQLAPGP